MKTLTCTAAIVMAMTASAAYAHHPSADMNPNYDTVEAQLIAVDSPHMDMDVSDMGSTTAAGDSTMATSARDQAGWQSNQAQPGGAFDADPPMDAAEEAATIGLMEDVGQ